ncbi:MAG: ADP-ribosylation factor-like protein [Candidatus Hodarchaeales archaeon]|jgi:GTPase SAR1 family protein
MSNVTYKTIKRISIINADTGIEIYEKDYQSSFFLEKDTQLISGFISALVQFSQEIVKDHIQEMVFSNSFLYLKRFSTILIVILTPLGIQRETVIPIFDLIGELIENQFTPDQLDFITPELSESIEEVVNGSLEKDVNLPTITSKRMGIAPKIVVAGLRKAGKTTAIRKFFDSWNEEQLQSIRPTVDYSIFHSFLEVVKTDLTIFDLGGQTQYVNQHLADETKWIGATTVFFIVDMHEPEEFAQAYDYLDKILKIFESLNETPFIALVGHKYDPDHVSELQPHLMNLLKTFKDLFKWPRYSVFLSSIYDDSLYLAFMRTLVRIIPRDLFQSILGSAIFFETQNRVWGVISEDINPEANSSRFREKIVKLSIPYGEKLANEIFQGWLSGGQTKEIEKAVNLIDVEMVDIAGGLQINIAFPKDGASPLLTNVIEGLLKGLGNVFGFSRVMKLHTPQKLGYISTSWGMFEF